MTDEKNKGIENFNKVATNKNVDEGIWQYFKFKRSVPMPLWLAVILLIVLVYYQFYLIAIVFVIGIYLYYLW